MKRFLISVFLFSLFLFLPVSASARSYQYDDIDTQITVNPDSTIIVREQQVYNFEGEYHQGLRSIALKNIGAVTDIEVWDGEVGEKLVYSPKKLDKTNPSSWGKYTYYKSNGAMNVEWYYNAANETHRWIIQYKVHGAITFGSQYDRLYWNVFTNYDVPVVLAQANVVLPAGVKVSDIKTAAYRTDKFEIGQSQDTSGLVHAFYSDSFSPYEAFTIDISWTKGVVTKAAFWKDWLGLNYGWLGVGLVIFIGFIIGLIYWLITEKWALGRGVVVAQYEPPRGLKPALMEVVLKEKTTNRALSATLIDLATRGYLEITEEPLSIFTRVGKFLALIPLVVILAAVVWTAQFNDIGVWIIIAVVIFIVIARFSSFLHLKNDYILKLLKKPDDTLTGYELHYLRTLFDYGKTEFSTKELRKSGSNVRRMFSVRMQKSEEMILKSADSLGDFYAVDNNKEKKKYIIWFSAAAVVVVAYICLQKFTALLTLIPQWLYVILAVILVVVFLYGFMKFETRLNKEGLKLKEEILGFKLYLYTAERYRLANLTPDMFEKYLPYAMIFGVEKKWSEAFARISLDSPAWYHNHRYGFASTAGVSASAASFSASAFSASFVSSFSSSFSSSSGSGSAGGGSAGGGGGGGGGGAS